MEQTREGGMEGREGARRGGNVRHKGGIERLVVFGGMKRERGMHREEEWMIWSIREGGGWEGGETTHCVRSMTCTHSGQAISTAATISFALSDNQWWLMIYEIRCYERAFDKRTIEIKCECYLWK